MAFIRTVASYAASPARPACSRFLALLPRGAQQALPPAPPQTRLIVVVNRLASSAVRFAEGLALQRPGPDATAISLDLNLLVSVPMCSRSGRSRQTRGHGADPLVAKGWTRAEAERVLGHPLPTAAPLLTTKQAAILVGVTVNRLHYVVR